VAIVPPGAVAQAAGLAKLLNDLTIPVVAASRELPGLKGLQVIVDEEEAAAQAVRHLVSLGHCRLAYVGPASEYSSSLLRYRGFRKACREAGLQERHCPHIEILDSISLPALKALFGASDSPTAVVAADENIAVAAYDLLSSLDLAIPEKVALVGLDGGTIAPSMEVPLTTVEFPGAAIGRQLAEELGKLAMAEQNAKSKKTITLRRQAKLVVRASCGSNPRKYRHEYLRGILERPVS
jgi:LacI family transcriptional regulator